jgi:hypothetical protein
MKLSHNFMTTLASQPIQAEDTDSFKIWNDYILDKHNHRWFLTNVNSHQMQIVSIALFSTFVNALSN